MIAAGIWGKLKTVSQMICIVLLLIRPDGNGMINVLTEVFVWLMLALTLISLAEYIWKNCEVLREG